MSAVAGRSLARGSAPTPNEADYAYCRAVMRQYGTSYYFATLFFPNELRKAVFSLYAFVRYPDQWVDCPSPEMTPERIRQLLDGYECEWLRAICGQPVEHPILRAFAHTVRQYGIPVKLTADFLDAMRMDLTQYRYPTFEALQQYTWGSASVIGVMMCYLFRQTDPQTLFHASQMGLAMQMTNFLRDVGEDYARGRIYLPQDEMARFGVCEAHFAQGRVDDHWRAFMRFQIARCRELYASAEQGIASLPLRVQFPVLLGARLYAEILRKIEQNGYDVFQHRAHTTYFEKVRLASRLYWEWRCGAWANG